jgi:8-oxo-dGTP diphosphatase
MPFTYEFARPALAVDCVVFGLGRAQPEAGDLRVLLVERAIPPFEGRWALPGGFVRVDETLDEAAARELSEEASVRVGYLEQLYTFGDVHRDPRDRVVSVAYFALVNPAEHAPRADTDARKVAWFSARALPPLAFDHDRIVATALERLRSKVRYRPIGFELLPPTFTLTQLQRMYECILGKTLDKRNFRKKLLSFDLLEATKEKETGVAHRAAQLYRFDRGRYDRLVERGFDFEL